MQTPELLLKAGKLRITMPRIEVLQVFLDNDFALSHADVADKISSKQDRVTLYRCFASFIESGILHKVIDDSGQARYALCQSHCSPSHHHDQHVHFKCVICQKSSCLTEASIPEIKLPLGYQIQHANMLLEGICKQCSDMQ